MATSNSPRSPALQSLWDFALAFYAQPQVAEICVQLQDHHRVNVCLLIGLRWLDDAEKYVSDDDLKDLHAHTQHWAQAVVVPLRSLRRLLKQPLANYAQDEMQEQVRAAVKQAELLAEKKLLLEIEGWLKRAPLTQNTCIAPNLERYLLSLGVSKDAIELLKQKF